MTYTVRYRAGDGTLREETVEAAGRAECVAALKARGIVPVSVKEGRAANVSAAPRGGIWKAAILAALVLAVVGVWLWARGGRGAAAPTHEENAAKAHERTAQRPARAEPKTAKGMASNKTAVVAGGTTNNPSAVAAKPKERHDTVSIHTNKLGKVVEKWIGADGKLHMSVRYARKPVFDNASDDRLAMAVSGNGMQSIPPIPMGATSEQEFLESLKKPIVIEADDPENVKQVKMAVIEARAQMKQLMDNGMSYREALAEHQRLVNENVDARNKCMAELKSLVDAGDREGAESYMKTMNAAFEQMGIPALTMPMSREELNAARRKRREEMEAAKQAGK